MGEVEVGEGQERRDSGSSRLELCPFITYFLNTAPPLARFGRELKDFGSGVERRGVNGN